MEDNCLIVLKSCFLIQHAKGIEEPGIGVVDQG